MMVGEREYKLAEGWRGRWINLKNNEIQTMITFVLNAAGDENYVRNSAL